MDTQSLAATFKALGDPTRVKIFEFLRSCTGSVALNDEGEVCPADGPTVGVVCCTVTGLDHMTSTISFHLKELRNAGLITMERRGKCMVCRVNEEKVNELATYLAQGEADPCCR